MDARREDCLASYDSVADEYVQRIFDELRHKPLDRQLLDRFADAVREVGPACDLGCGPGQVAQYLHERGVQVTGIDLSPAMVERARRLVPGVEFRRGDMTALDLQDGTLAGIAAFYSIIHIPREDHVRTLTELRRILRPGGLLLLVFHIGDSTIHLDEWWGRKVSVDFHFFPTADIAVHLRTAGLTIEEIFERDPYPDVEYQSRRAYIFARKPDMPDLRSNLNDWLARLSGPGFKGFEDRNQAVAEMRAEGADRLFPVLVPMLASPDPEVRCTACEAVLCVDAERAIELVLPLLEDPDVMVRWHASGCLHDFGDGRAIDPLIGVLQNDSDAQVRNTAAYALGGIACPAAIPALLTAMECDHERDIHGHSASSRAATALDDILGTNETRIKVSETLRTMRDGGPDLDRLRVLAEQRYQEWFNRQV